MSDTVGGGGSGADKDEARMMLVLLDDPLMLRAAVAWPRVPRRGRCTSWRNTRWDLDAWSRMVRIDRYALAQIARGLQDAGLIRPDGTVSKAVETVAGRELVRRMKMQQQA